MLTLEEVKLQREIRLLERMLKMAEDTIKVQRTTSDRLWCLVHDLVAGRKS